MQGKVSMVMPCYNKVEYIGEMFDSILAQKWDNIELVIVNDGSTDGTRDIITHYTPKFLDRGYELVIIDQENKGVCAAAQAGLRRITGDYVCLVDADDELDPEYCSTMAAWLDEHKDYDYCVCNRISYMKTDCGKQYSDYPIGDFKNDDSKLLEKYLLWSICRVVWIYFLRRTYFEKCKITENYETTTKGSHEPGYVIPVLANNGKYRLIEKKLYRFNVGRNDGHSDFSDYEKTLSFLKNYEALCVRAISTTDCLDETRKKYLSFLSRLSRKISNYEYALPLCKDEEEKNNFYKSIIEFLDVNTYGMPYVFAKMYYEFDFLTLLKFMLIYPNETPIVHKKFRRVIGYGVLGKNAQKFERLFSNTDMAITDRWDINGDGATVVYPDMLSLTDEDCILIFPKKPEIIEEIKSKAKDADIWDFEKIKLFLFGQLTLPK